MGYALARIRAFVGLLAGSGGSPGGRAPFAGEPDAKGTRHSGPNNSLSVVSSALLPGWLPLFCYIRAQRRQSLSLIRGRPDGRSTRLLVDSAAAERTRSTLRNSVFSSDVSHRC